MKLRAGNLPTLVWGLDNEPGARDYTHKHARRADALGFKSHAALIAQPVTGKRSTGTICIYVHRQAATARSNGTRR